jgi:hypothetical protein
MSEALTIEIGTGVTIHFATAGAARVRAQYLGILLSDLLEVLTVSDADDEVMRSAVMIARDMATEIRRAGDCADSAGLASRKSAEVANA